MFVQYEMGDEGLNRSYPFLKTKRSGILPFVVDGIGEYQSDKDYYTRREGRYDCLLLYTVSGQGVVEYEGSRFVLEPGHILVMDCRKYHYYATQVERWHFCWIHFYGKCAFDYVKELNEESGLPIYIGNRISFENYFENILFHVRHYSRQSEMEISVLLHRLLTDLISLRNKDAFSLKYSSYQKELEDGIGYMKNNYVQNISVERMAEACHLSKYYYIKMFKAYTGQTPYDYLLNYRLQIAQQLLINTEKTVEEVAKSCGFTDSKNFIACFKKKNGITPLQFRKKNRLA